MTHESVSCPKCEAVGWVTASAINEKVKRTITCGNCRYEMKYIKKAWKSPVIK